MTDHLEKSEEIESILWFTLILKDSFIKVSPQTSVKY